MLFSTLLTKDVCLLDERVSVGVTKVSHVGPVAALC